MFLTLFSQMPPVCVWRWETDRQMSGQGRQRGGGRIDVTRAVGRGAGCSNRRRMAIKRDYTGRGKCRTQQ